MSHRGQKYVMSDRPRKPYARTVPYPQGEASHTWKGDEVGYNAAHTRIRRLRGRASQFTCPCGRAARDWAYDYTDPQEKVSRHRQSFGRPYSTDVERYVAMCRRCHMSFDRARSERGELCLAA